MDETSTHRRAGAGATDRRYFPTDDNLETLSLGRHIRVCTPSFTVVDVRFDFQKMAIDLCSLIQPVVFGPKRFQVRSSRVGLV